MVGMIILECDMVGVLIFQFGKEIIKGRGSWFFLVLNRTGSEHFHYHCKILFIFRSFVMKIEYKCKQKH